MTMIIRCYATAARLTAGKFSPAKTGNDRNCKSATQDIFQLIWRERSLRVVIPIPRLRERNLTIEVAVTLNNLHDATPSEKFFAPLSTTTQDFHHADTSTKVGSSCCADRTQQPSALPI